MAASCLKKLGVTQIQKLTVDWSFEAPEEARFGRGLRRRCRIGRAPTTLTALDKDSTQVEVSAPGPCKIRWDAILF